MKIKEMKLYFAFGVAIISSIIFGFGLLNINLSTSIPYYDGFEQKECEYFDKSFSSNVFRAQIRCDNETIYEEINVNCVGLFGSCDEVPDIGTNTIRIYTYQPYGNIAVNDNLIRKKGSSMTTGIVLMIISVIGYMVFFYLIKQTNDEMIELSKKPISRSRSNTRRSVV